MLTRKKSIVWHLYYLYVGDLKPCSRGLWVSLCLTRHLWNAGWQSLFTLFTFRLSAIRNLARGRQLAGVILKLLGYAVKLKVTVPLFPPHPLLLHLLYEENVRIFAVHFRLTDNICVILRSTL